MSLTYRANIAVKPTPMKAACSAIPGIIICKEWQDHAAPDFHDAQGYTRDVFAPYEGWLVKAPEPTETRPMKA
ncbi:hypothetical protein RM533_02395 [Croceicoccus sp. F390]|uniref:Uncharacterized protein n=1 Tax=Croceicoccus esteveae TaxID=3075597 RepID=A0ABU2ZFN8_9SPHN|nr:hypothetical protein [Croceicoccus sp. F390]MDT0575031.1 hypothetical protein [Croceicoccus sp. F390]